MVGDVERLPCLQRFDRRLVKDRGDLRERRFLRDNDALDLAQSRLSKKRPPAEVRCERLKLGDRHRIISSDGIALLRLRPARVRDLGLETYNLGRALIRVRPIEKMH